MHELGVVIEVVKNVEEFARAHNVTRVDTLVLQIGALSAMIPRYVEACYPAAVDGTLLEETKLRIEVIPGAALCRKCGHEFDPEKHQKMCPSCSGTDCEIIRGREFMIKEILAC